MKNKMKKKWVYTFEEGDWRNVHLLGGKGAGLCRMTQLGLPVPPGFIITTEACKSYFDNNNNLPPDLMKQVREGMKYIEEKIGRKFGDENNPLLVSVRSGAPVSMPGMMSTILNLGINDKIVKGLAKQLNDVKAAYDIYRRFLYMFGSIVLKIDEKEFIEAFNNVKKRHSINKDDDLSVEILMEIIDEYKKIIRKHHKFIDNPWEQLKLAIKAVFDSWNNPRAIFYRKINNITPDMASGTAVNIMAMVFGNLNINSGTGVIFTRNPATGENKLFGEFLIMAQGEDIVSGTRTPLSIDELQRINPQLYDQLYRGAKLLERINKEVQDIEFTIENGKLYFLQTRNGKMTPIARVKTAVDMVKDGILTREEAILKIQPEHIEQILYPRIDPSIKIKPVTKGLPSSPGAASGLVVFDPHKAVILAGKNKPVILVREETKPEDIQGIHASIGILTRRGGMTSHAAVVARALGKPCIVGCESIKIDYKKKLFTIPDKNITVHEEEWITIDGFTGDVYIGKIPTTKPKLPSEFYELLSWAGEFKKLGVLANADVPDDILIAKKFNAEGIGLLRTEWMFREPKRLDIFRKMILAETREERIKYLEILIPFLKSDFIKIFKIMEGLPVIIRLFDPPLHEYLPNEIDLITKVTELKIKGEHTKIKDIEKTLKRIQSLREINPMMGHRGVRIGVTYPEIYEAQIRAIFEAIAELIKNNIKVDVSIMVPQVCEANEASYIKEYIIKPCKTQVESTHSVKISFKYGTMIEVVRSCLVADELAQIVDFFSFGTNDLTQGTFAFSRDDAERKFIPKYIELKILREDPFKSIDEKGVGKLMKIAINLGRKVKKRLEVGICGEHGGDPKSIEFFHKIGVDYVSTSPYRIPIAKLVAAQVAIKSKYDNNNG